MKFTILIAFIIFGLANCQFNPSTCANSSQSTWENQFNEESCGLDYDDDGPKPGCKKSVASGVQDLIDKLYPEKERLTDGLISDKISFTILEEGSYAYITFLLTGAGYRNRLGLYYMENGDIKYLRAFPFVNSFDQKCLKSGDTAVVGPLHANVRYGIYLDADFYGSNPKGKIYSDVTFKSGLGTSDNVGHVSWVYNEESEDTIFGFEDAINGDYDYNDIMFTLNIDGAANFTNRPIYSNGTIKECLKLDTVTSSSYAEHECFSWALLEKTEVTSCSFLLEVPPGWIVAPYDQKTKDAISTIDKWDVSCVGVMDGGSLKGVLRSDPDVECPLNQYNRTSGDYGENCFGVACSQRVVLRRVEQLQSCGQGYDYCESSPRTLSTFPSTDLNWNVFPNQIDSFLGKDAGSQYKSYIDVRNKQSSGKTIVDVVVAFDLEGIGSKDVKAIKDNMKSAYQALQDKDLQARVAFGAYSGSAYSITLFKEAHDSDDENIIVAKKEDGSKLKIDMIQKATSYNYGWNQDEAVKIVLIVTHREVPSITQAQIDGILDNNVIVLFAGTAKDFKDFASNFKNSVGRKISKGSNSNFEKFAKELGNDVASVVKYSVIHTVKGSQYVSYNTGKQALVSNAYKHEVNVIMASPTPNPNTKAAVLNVLGRSQVSYFIHTNRAPLASDALVVDFVSGEAELKLEVSDPDNGKFDIRFTNFDNSDLDGTVTFLDSSDNVIGLNQNFTSPSMTVQANGTGSFVATYIVDDGCETATAQVTVLIGCSTPQECRVPKCSSQTISVKKRETVSFQLTGFYDGGSADKITKEVTRIDGPDDVVYFFDSSSLGHELDIGVSGESVQGFYKSDSLFGQNLHTLTYKVYNTDHKENPDYKYSVCTVTMTVTASNDPPEYSGEDVFVVYEDNKLIFRVDEQKVKYEDESIQLNRRLGVKLDASGVKGTFRCCFDSVCSACDFETYNQDDPLPAFEFTPIGNDYGDEANEYMYTSVKFTFFDRAQSNPSTIQHIVSIRVLPVNDAPTIEVDEGVKTLDVSNEANVINKGEEFVFSWNVFDIDNLPSELTSIVTASPFTRSPWKAYSCLNAEEECSKELELDPLENIVRTSVEVVNCESAATLKSQLGVGLEACYARFTLRFVPGSSATPYIKFAIQGTDNQELNSLSATKHILVNVMPTNLPPTVWSPPKIESTSLLTNIRVGNQTCNTTDDSPPVWIVTLTMTSISKNGQFVLPTSAVSKCSVSEDSNVVVCDDTIGSINNWIKELRFNISEGSNEANISFVVSDNGYPGLPDALLSEVSYTHIVVDSSIIPPPPKSSSKLLIIALSVGAAGAIAVGVLVALLRNKLSPPADNYFQLGTETVSSSPESPLYRGQTKEGFSGLYSGAKA